MEIETAWPVKAKFLLLASPDVKQNSRTIELEIVDKSTVYECL